MSDDGWEQRMAVNAQAKQAINEAELAAVATGESPRCTKAVRFDIATGEYAYPCARAEGHDGWCTNGVTGEGHMAWA